MARINRKPIRPTTPRRNILTDNNCDKYYGSMAWRRFRTVYKSEHPVCEICLQHHRIEPTIDLHHRKPFLNGATEEERWDLFLKESNVIALCEKCHAAVHNKMREYHLDYCDSLNEKEWKLAHVS